MDNVVLSPTGALMQRLAFYFFIYNKQRGQIEM